MYVKFFGKNCYDFITKWEECKFFEKIVMKLTIFP